MKSSKNKFKFAQCVIEDHKRAIYSVQFNRYVNYDLFATVGANRITVYKIEDDSIEPLLCFADQNPNEEYYCCAWGIDIRTKQKDSLVLAAGSHGIIRIISPYNTTPIKYLSGHGSAINDLKVSPTNPELVLSASKDHSLRLWNMCTDVCIAIFGGVEGHRDSVLSADFHLSGTRIVSCGLDHALKIWTLDEEIMGLIETSRKYNDMIEDESFPTVRKHFPTFSTRDIHENYVDCVSWFEDYVLSKSCQNVMTMWRPGKAPIEDYVLPQKYTTDSTASIICHYRVKHCNLWFVRFSMDPKKRFLALGNTQGKIYLFDLKMNSKSELVFSKCRSTIRQTCFNNDGSKLICTCEDGSILRWDNQLGD